MASGTGAVIGHLPTVPGQPSPHKGNYLRFQNRRCSSSGRQFAANLLQLGAVGCSLVPEGPKVWTSLISLSVRVPAN